MVYDFNPNPKIPVVSIFKKGTEKTCLWNRFPFIERVFTMFACIRSEIGFVNIKPLLDLPQVHFVNQKKKLGKGKLGKGKAK